MYAHKNIKHVNLQVSRTMLLTNARIVTLAGDHNYGLIEDGAIALDGEQIAWVGPNADLPA